MVIKITSRQQKLAAMAKERARIDVSRKQQGQEPAARDPMVMAFLTMKRLKKREREREVMDTEVKYKRRAIAMLGGGRVVLDPVM